MTRGLFEVDEKGGVRTRKDAPNTLPGIDPAAWIVAELRAKRPHYWPTSQGGGACGAGFLPSAGADDSCFDPSSPNYNFTAQLAAETKYGADFADKARAVSGPVTPEPETSAASRSGVTWAKRLSAVATRCDRAHVVGVTGSVPGQSIPRRKVRQKRTVSMYTDVQKSITDQHAAAETLGSRRGEHREQEEREQLFKRRTIESAILEAAEEKWREEHEFGGDVDPVARTVTVGTFGADDGVTYRYGFDSYGNLLLWNEADGEQAPEELADDADAPASCEGCRSSGLSESESRSIHNES